MGLSLNAPPRIAKSKVENGGEEAAVRQCGRWTMAKNNQKMNGRRRRVWTVDDGRQWRGPDLGPYKGPKKLTNPINSCKKGISGSFIPRIRGTKSPRFPPTTHHHLSLLLFWLGIGGSNHLNCQWAKPKPNRQRPNPSRNAPAIIHFNAIVAIGPRGLPSEIVIFVIDDIVG